MDARANADRSWMKLRLGLVEHPVATMKWMMGSPRFLVGGLTKAKSEFALGDLDFNLKRMVTLLGAPRLTEALTDGAG